jgi:O-antigen/teichoic acid export membrane protein
VWYASAIVALDLIVLRQTEIFFLNRFSTPANIAYYGLGRSLAATAMLLVPGVLTALLLPMMSRTFGEDPALLGKRFLAATRYILILAVPVVALCELFAGDIVVALYGIDYSPAVRVLRVSAAASAVGVVSASASSYQLGTDRQPAIVLIMTTVAVITLTLDYFLIRSFGLDGAIAAGAAGSVLLGAVLLWHARRTLQVTFQSSTYLRVVLAGGVATLPVFAIRYLMPAWMALPIGTLMFVVVYAVLTVVLRTWTRQELTSMSAMADILPTLRSDRP